MLDCQMEEEVTAETRGVLECRESQKSSSKKRPRPSDGSVQPPAPVHPIIILPASASARITMLNVKVASVARAFQMINGEPIKQLLCLGISP